MKRLTSILLVILMTISVFSSLSISANAGEITASALSSSREDFKYVVLSDNTAKITGYTGEETELEIPSEIDSYEVTFIEDGAFSWNENLTNITFPNSIISMGNYVFSGCKNLTNVTFSKGLTHIGSDVFDKCESLVNINVDSNNTAYCSVDGVLFNKDKTVLIHYPMGKTETSYVAPDSVITVGDKAFYSCEKLASITFSKGLTEIGDSAFYGCKGLIEVTLPEGVLSIGDRAFCWCDSLTNLTLPDSVTFIGEEAFCWCNSLADIKIPSSVTFIGSVAFYNCEGLTNIKLPKSVTFIGDYAFYSCPKLESIDVDSDNTAYCSEEGILFNKDKTILIQYPMAKPETSYIIPQSVTTIGKGAFYSCERLTDVTILGKVTSISDRVFEYCGNLTNIVISDKITSIGDEAFSKCKDLKNVYYTGDETKWNIIEIGEENEYLTSATIQYNYVCEHIIDTIEGYDETCTQDGLTEGQKCSKCGETLVAQEVIPALGHKHTSEITKEATCTEDGVETYSCDCGDTYTEVIPALGHNYTSVVTKDATCTEDGVKTFTCTCGDSYTEVIKATGHKHTSKVTKKATCTQEGVTTYTCACGDTYTKKIAKVAHVTTKSTKKATYFANGYKNRETCKNCKAVVKKGTTLKKLKLKTPKVKYTASKKKLTVKYTKVSGATGFQVKYKIGKKSVTKTYSTKKSVKKTIKKLKKGTYKVYVRAFVKSGSKKAYSSWTKAKKVKVKG